MYDPLACLVIGAVVLLLIMRRFRLSWFEFMICLGGLALALVSMLSTVESFFDSAEAAMIDIVIPKLDLLARSMMPDEQQDQAQAQDVTGEEVPIDAARYGDSMSAEQVNVVSTQYHQIALLMCGIESYDANAYAGLMNRLHAFTGVPVKAGDSTHENADADAAEDAA